MGYYFTYDESGCVVFDIFVLYLVRHRVPVMFNVIFPVFKVRKLELYIFDGLMKELLFGERARGRR